MFPCLPGQKRPAIADNLSQATTDAAKINGWWAERPDANIGCVPGKSFGGCFVLDVDMKGEGYTTLFQLEDSHGALPETLTISTPSGGTHYWLLGQAATTARKLGPGLDTRGDAGYVLLPGSVLDGGRCYELAKAVDIAGAPPWLAAALRPDERKEETASAEVDTEFNVARAVAFLEHAEVAVEGNGGDLLTYQTAQWLRDFGLSEETATTLLLEHWNDRCEPPWDPDELAVKVENAYAYAQNEAGSKALPSPQEAYATLAATTAAEAAPPPGFKYKLRTMREARERPEPEWITPGRWPRDALAFVYGPGDSYKSFNVLNDVLDMAYAGERVLYIAGEGAHGVDKKRVPAWMMARYKNQDADLRTLDIMPPARSTTELERFCKDILGQGFAPTVLVIDTLARFMVGLNENDARDAGLVIGALDGIRRTFPGALIIVIHHSGKESERGMRGSSALHAGGDVVYRVHAEHNTLAVKIACEKMKDAEAPDLLFREGRVVGGSLVFDDIDVTAYRKATSDEGHSWKATGRSLARLGQVVSTEVLATDILADLAEEIEPDELEKRKRALIRELKKMAAGPLAAYVLSEPGSREPRWGIKIDA